MNRYLKLDIENALSFLDVSEFQKMEQEIKAANSVLREGTGEGNDYLGWVSLPESYDKNEFARNIKRRVKKRKKIREKRSRRAD